LLNTADTTEFLEARFSEHQFPPAFAQLLQRHTDGNPLFLINVLDYLVSRSLLAVVAGSWRLTVSLDELNLGVPDSLLQIIGKQLVRLSDKERCLLEAASVAGVEFCVGRLAEGAEAE
jgi:predicted ATPase